MAGASTDAKSQMATTEHTIHGAMSAVKRIPQLDGLRAFAVTAVFLSHVSTGVKLGWIGVDLFFVLSGFLITGILVQSKDHSFRAYIGGFYARRVRRILPAYIAILIVTTLLFGVGWLANWYLYVGAMNFLLPFGLGPPTIWLLWSLAVEEQFYLLWPVIVFFLSRKQIVSCAVGLLVLAPLLRFVCTGLFRNHWMIYALLPFRMDTLAAGSLIALTKHRWSRKNAIVGATVMLFAGLASIIWLAKHGLSGSSNTHVSNVVVYESTLFIVTGVFVLALFGVGKSVLCFAPIRWLGIVSYSVYLFQVNAVYLASRPRMPLALRPLVTAVLTVGYAAGMWFLVERPILNFRKNRAVELKPA
jgi:peptidoglycan/LPS O-acetylase OafA/YrhL